jgi:glycosyltransferase involved in cell wall biosynthesis
MPPGSLMAKKAYWIDRIACQLADIVLSDSDATTVHFAATFRLREAKFRRVWVGADDDVLKPSFYDLENSPFTVFFTGSFIPLQGVEYIVRAAKVLEQKGEDVQFILTGAGQTLQTMIDLVSDLAVSNVRFKAPMPYEQLTNAMSQAHLCLGIFGTSPKAQHGIPNKVFFAFAAKQPVVTGDTRAMREVFTHGENIWLCPPGDAQALAESLVELKHRPELRAKIAANAYEVFVRKFSINAISADIVAILRELCQTPPAEVVTPVAQAESGK